MSRIGSCRGERYDGGYIDRELLPSPGRFDGFPIAFLFDILDLSFRHPRLDFEILFKTPVVAHPSFFNTMIPIAGFRSHTHDRGDIDLLRFGRWGRWRWRGIGDDNDWLGFPHHGGSEGPIMDRTVVALTPFAGIVSRMDCVPAHF